MYLFIGRSHNICVDFQIYIFSELRRLLLAESLYDSMKFGLVLYLLTFVGAIFNTLTLVIIGCVFAFILPKVISNFTTFYNVIFFISLFTIKTFRKFIIPNGQLGTYVYVLFHDEIFSILMVLFNFYLT